jgi:type I restriction enzyme, S subunit
MAVKEGYKQTEVGVIPEDWNCTQLSDIGESIIGLTYSPSDIKNGGILVLRSSNIDGSKLVFNDNVYVDVKVNDKLIVQKNDILICVRNGSRDLIGKCAIIDEKSAGQTFGAFMSIFRSEYGRYLFNVFQSSIVKKQINQHLGATINQITNKSLNSFYVPLPKSAEEQHSIATALSDIDGLINSLTKLIEKKKNIKQGAMQELLTGKKRLDGFSGEWVEVRLSDVLEIGHGQSQQRIENIKGKYPILGSSGEIGRTDTFLYDKPSVLIGRKGTINDPQYMDSPFWTIDTLFYTKLKHSISAKFIYYLFCTINWLNYNEASGVPSLSSKTIKSIRASIPLYIEQTAIATILSDMDTEIETLQAKRNKYKAIKQGMMQELLTGRIRLLEGA